MKKIFIILSVCVFILTGCKEKKKEIIDYSEYSFTDVSWTRDTEYDTETISFHSDGSFRYSCSCGNPVNDSDICETYTYNDETKEIKLECLEPMKDTITTIKIINYTEDTLELDFDGETRMFSIEE